MNSREVVAFGALLRSTRLGAGLTQESLAERAGLSVRGIQDLERGATRPLRGTLARLAEALSLSPASRTEFDAFAAAGRPRQPQPVPPLARNAPPALASAFPSPLSPLFGREAEVAAIGILLARRDVRLLTITGPAGVGKTRVAIAATGTIAAQFAAGALFVDLGPLRDAELLADYLARALDTPLPPGQETRVALREQLSSRQVLLVLDTFEHLLAGTPLLADLLGTCPGLTMLVTSRTVLRVRGEHLFPLATLATPPLGITPQLGEATARYPAVALFLDRARASVPHFVMAEESTPVVVAICRELDGLPLAIELAATRLRLLSPSALLARLDRRLQILTGGDRELPDRQQTLRDAIGWSYELLGAGERALFAQLATFSGGWTVEAAERVCMSGGGDTAASVLDALSSLADQSLIRREQTGEGIPARYGMLRAIREYALERMADQDSSAVAARHACFYLDLAERAAMRLRGPNQDSAFTVLGAEGSNISDALQWACAHQDAVVALPGGLDGNGWDLGARLCVALQDLWEVRGQWREAATPIDSLLSSDRHRMPGREQQSIALQCAASRLALLGGDSARAIFWAEAGARAAEVGGDLPGLVLTRATLGRAVAQSGDYSRAVTLLDWARDAAERAGSQWEVASALVDLGAVARARGEIARAVAYGESGLALFRELGGPWGIAQAMQGLAEAAQEGGEYRRAVQLFGESLNLRRALGDRQGIATTLIRLGHLARVRGDHAGAMAIYHESLELLQEAGDREGIARCFEGIGFVLCARGYPEQGARLFGAVAGLQGAPDGAASQSGAGRAARGSGGRWAALHDDAYAAGWMVGMALPLDRSINYAREMAATGS